MTPPTSGMAFATVAGATMAIATTLGLLLDRVHPSRECLDDRGVRRHRAVVCSWEVGVIAGAADPLLVV